MNLSVSRKLLSLLVAGLILGCSKGSGLHASKEITILTDQIPLELNPAATIAYNSVYFFDNLLPRLFRVNGKMQLEGDLANTWEIKKDQKILQVTLKTAWFSNGKKVTAQDVKDSIIRVLSKKALASSFFHSIDKIEVLSDSVIAFHYFGWEGSLFQQLASPFLGILYRGLVLRSDNPAGWITHSAVSIKEWSKEGMILSEGQRILKVLPPSQQKRESPSVDFMIPRLNWLNKEKVDPIDSNNTNSYTKYILDSFNTSLIFLSDKIPKQKRQCFVFEAHNSEELKDLLGENRNHSILPFGFLSYRSGPVSYPRIASASLPKSDVRLLVKRLDDENSIVFRVISKLALECGIRLSVEADSESYYNRLIHHKFDAALVTISAIHNDPYFIYAFFDPRSRFYFSAFDSKMVSMIDSLNRAGSQHEVSSESGRIQERILSEGLAIPLMTTKTMALLKKPLQLPKSSGFDLVRWEDIR